MELVAARVPGVAGRPTSAATWGSTGNCDLAARARGEGLARSAGSRVASREQEADTGRAQINSRTRRPTPRRPTRDIAICMGSTEEAAARAARGSSLYLFRTISSPSPGRLALDRTLSRENRGYVALKCLDLPPDFSRRRIDSMRMARSLDLHMS